MDLGLSGRTALVCGASSGLGLASAEALAEEGANVALFARRADQLEEHAARLGGVPLRKLVSEERIQQMVERTAKGGGEIVQLLGTSAWYAPGAAVAEMVDAILLDQKRVLPCTALLEGEYGIDGLYIGVPVKLGAGGIEEIVELDLSDDEREALERSADAVRDVVGVLST